MKKMVFAANDVATLSIYGFNNPSFYIDFNTTKSTIIYV